METWKSRLLGNEFFGFFNSLQQSFFGFKELNDVGNLEHFEVNQHTSDLGGILIIALQKGLDFREQQFAQDGALT